MDVNKALLFGGIGLTIAAILAAVILVFVFRVKKERINAQMDKEYGEPF